MGGVFGVDDRGGGRHLGPVGAQDAGAGEGPLERFAEPELDGRGRMREFGVRLRFGAHQQRVGFSGARRQECSGKERQQPDKL